MKTPLIPLLPLVALIITSAPLGAAAQSPASPPTTADSEVVASDWRPGFGARIGGYGFRAADQAEGLTWFDCRMDGIGLLTTLDMGPHLFAELSVDFYQATEDVITDGHMDRVSLLSFAALGLRLAPDWIVSPFIQLGGGAEWTRLTMLDAAEIQDVYPVAFMGAGAEVDLTETIKIGVGLRFMAMIHPDHAHPTETGGQLDPPHDDGPVQAPSMSFSPAAQGLGWIRASL